MGIYVFSHQVPDGPVAPRCRRPQLGRDFGKDIIPYIVEERLCAGRTIASRSCVRSSQEGDAYWRDVGTVDAYWEANIDLTDILPELDIYDREWPIWTYAEIKPPAKFVHDQDGRRGSAVSSLVSGDCIISGASLRKSLLFTGVRVNSFSALEEAVVLPDCHIGRNATLRKVVLDRGVKIPEGLSVGFDPESDARRFRVSEGGVCLITQSMIDRLSN
jgi:glucose-1-phosphate adenylyltransferase